ncbi:hypothetical protein ACIP9C_12520 [Lysinibacillus sp. NPDC093210]
MSGTQTIYMIAKEKMHAAKDATDHATAGVAAYYVPVESEQAKCQALKQF